MKRKKVYWKDLLEAFKRVPENYYDLGIIYGGDDVLESFIGFDTVGNIYNHELTVKEVIEILEKLPSEKLNSEILLDDEDESIDWDNLPEGEDPLENTLMGDLEAIYLGPLRVHCSTFELTEEDCGREYYPVEDFGHDEIHEDDKYYYENELGDDDVLIRPFEKFVMMTKDGSRPINWDDNNECIEIAVLEE